MYASCSSPPTPASISTFAASFLVLVSARIMMAGVVIESTFDESLTDDPLIRDDPTPPSLGLMYPAALLCFPFCALWRFLRAFMKSSICSAPMPAISA